MLRFEESGILRKKKIIYFIAQSNISKSKLQSKLY